ncbi:MAG: RluA family pseudouridine synthase [Lentisphaeria bacterium]|nr:RluA family pseudouridine synthase [Lentisphaeria bacterium]
MGRSFADKLARRQLYSHVPEVEDGAGLPDYLAAHFSRFDRAGWIRAIETGLVTVNDRPALPGATVKRHDRVGYFPPEMPEPDAELQYRVLHEDGDLLVIDKPGNLCMHPTGPFFRHTLWHLVGSRYGEIRFVHRLDRETSGLVIAARTRRAAAAMDNGNTPVHKEYLALVTGDFRGRVHAEGILVHDRSSAVRKKKRFVFADSPDADATRLDPTAETAVTDLIEESHAPSDMTLVRAVLGTGRQHQVRATLYSLGFPLAGDKLYGPDERLFLKIKSQSLTGDDLAKLRFARQALHAAVLEFRHPFTGENLRFESPFPRTEFQF